MKHTINSMTSAPHFYSIKPGIVEAKQAGGKKTIDWLQAHGYEHLKEDATRPGELPCRKGYYIDPSDGYIVIRNWGVDCKVRENDYIVHSPLWGIFVMGHDEFHEVFQLTGVRGDLA